MTIIVIKDLQESVELDRQAMLAISGGARFGGRASVPKGPALRDTRLVDFSPRPRTVAPRPASA
jgi:hypothetical protein